MVASNRPQSMVKSLAARGETPAAFGPRCIPAPPHRAEKRAVGAPAADCVAPPSNIPDILSRRALSAGRLAALGATADFHHGLLRVSRHDSFTGIFCDILFHQKGYGDMARVALRRA